MPLVPDLECGLISHWILVGGFHVGRSTNIPTGDESLSTILKSPIMKERGSQPD